MVVAVAAMTMTAGEAAAGTAETQPSMATPVATGSEATAAAAAVATTETTGSAGTPAGTSIAVTPVAAQGGDPFLPNEAAQRSAKYG